MSENAVLLQHHEEVAIITLNRPERLNAINAALLQELAAHLQAAGRDDAIRSVVLTGAGRAFCAGEDLKETSRGKTVDQWQAEIRQLQHIARLMLHLDKPLIAAVRGYAVGGGLEFALGCDIRLASADARFGFPETGVGLTITGAGTKLITHIVGLGRAKELVFTGEFIDAAEAHRIGLVNRIVTSGEVCAAAVEMARAINRRSAMSLRLSRIALDQGTTADVEQTLALEASHLLACVAAGNQNEPVEQRLATMRNDEPPC